MMGGGSQTCLKNWKLLEYSANPVRSAGGGDGCICVCVVGKPSGGGKRDPPPPHVRGGQWAEYLVSWEQLWE